MEALGVNLCFENLPYFQLNPYFYLKRVKNPPDPPFCRTQICYLRYFGKKCKEIFSKPSPSLFLRDFAPFFLLQNAVCHFPGFLLKRLANKCNTKLFIFLTTFTIKLDTGLCTAALHWFSHGSWGFEFSLHILFPCGSTYKSKLVRSTVFVSFIYIDRERFISSLIFRLRFLYQSQSIL